MARYGSDSVSAASVVGGIAGMLFGVIVGYVAAQSGATRPAAVGAPTVAATSAAATAPIVDERELSAYKDILAGDPENVRAAIELGNRLYDAGRYADAVPYYEQALALEPRNISVSTDLATALWYAGRVDAALAQFEKSLAIDSGHPQTLYNLGIVRRDGKADLDGAMEAWEALIARSPATAEAGRARTLVGQLRQQRASAGAGTSR